MKITLDRGFKTYDIEDADGTKLGSIRLNLADPALPGRWEQLKDELAGIHEEAITVADTVVLDQQVKAKLDYALGCKASDVFFGGASCVAICDDGATIMEHVLEALASIMVDALKTGAKLSEARIKQRTAAYDGSTAGLAPGQQA